VQQLFTPKDLPVAFAPAKFVRDVRAEAAKVTWPSARETGMTTLMVLLMSVITAVFFMVVDWAIGFAVRFLFASTN
jgi:preprotein translocase subunit SecE